MKENTKIFLKLKGDTYIINRSFLEREISVAGCEVFLEGEEG